MKELIVRLKAAQAEIAEVIAEMERREALIDRVDAAQDSVKAL